MLSPHLFASASALSCLLALAGCEVKFNPPTAADGTSRPADPAAANTNAPPDNPGEEPEPYINPKTKKDVAEEQLAKFNGKVVRDKKQPDSPVVEIRLYGDKTTDADLKELTAFPKLRWLEPRGKEITGTGFAALADLPLEELHLGWLSNLDNAGMKEIAKIKTLKVLILPQGKFDDDGLKEIATLTNLEELYVSGFKIGDRGFAPLKTLTKLRKVNANNCKVGDGAMKTLSELPEMRSLKLYGSGVTDTGYGYVGKMAKLEELQTSYNITDKGLAELGNLKHLKNLSVWNSSVTIKGIRALPNLKQFKDLDIGTWNIKAEEADKLRGELPDCNVVFKK